MTQYAYFPDADGDHNRAGQLQKITDALNHVTQYSSQSGFTSYDPFGNAQSITDPNAVVVEYAYDPRGRMLTATLLGVTGASTNLVTTWAYDGAGRLLSIKKPLNNGLSLSYDTSDRLAAAARYDASGLQQERLTFAYNANDQVTQRVAQGCSAPAINCPGWTTTWNLSYIFSPTTSDLSTITNADSTSRGYSYIASGAVATINDENHPTGANFTYAFDVAGRRLSETRKLGAGSVVAKYTYDLHNNPNSLTDQNNNVTTYHFDDFDRVQKEVSPVQGTTTYSYDPDSNLVSSTDANAITTTYAYDALDRELSEKDVKGTQSSTTTWSYDNATAGNFGIGRLAKHVDASGSTAYTYDRRGLIAIENRTISGKAFTQSYTYDGNGNRKTITYPDGYIVGMGYDFADRPYSAQHQQTLLAAQLQNVSRRGLAASSAIADPEPVITPAPGYGLPANPIGRPTSPIAPGAPGRATLPHPRGVARIPVPAPPSVHTFGSARTARRRLAGPNTISADVFVSATTYEPFGPMTAMAFGNGTQQSMTYNLRYFPTDNQLISPTSTVLADHGYAEDAVGNITALNDKLDAGYDRSFMYDDLNRLTTANAGAKLWGTATGNGYTYDPMGNLKTLQLGTGRTDTFNYKSGGTGSTGLPELSSVVENGTSRTLSYDAFGNETRDGKSTFGYTFRELLASDSLNVSTYAYDAFRRRVYTKLKSGSIRDSFFDPDRHTLAETAQFTTGSPTIAYKYVWLGDRPVAEVDSGGTHWTYTDHLGTPLEQTDINAATTWQAEHEPFGTVYALRSGDVHQPLRFPGQVSEQFDAGPNGLTERSYNNARWYRPNWGRYTQADRIGVGRMTNLYEYALDDPQLIIDPTGKDPSSLVGPMQQFNPNTPYPPGKPTPPPAGNLGWYNGPTYGNYCGQYRTNGKSMSQAGLLPSQIGGPNNPPAVNGSDSCCGDHDQCRAFCDGFYKCLQKNQGSCHCACDQSLAQCLGTVKPGDPQEAVANVVFGAFMKSSHTAQLRDCHDQGT